ncbi:MAG: hypothetical protein KatS3mg102_1821 [Planctomycetota bacterium]|nr:MAG: hypothetical protein KatS3mg102_1821 [Planctomycetota bacterium]
MEQPHGPQQQRPPSSPPVPPAAGGPAAAAADAPHAAPRAPRRLSRRRLLKLGGLVAAAGGLGLYRCGLYDERLLPPGLRVLGRREAAIAAAVIETVLPPEPPPSPERVRTLLAAIDAYLLGLPAEQVEQLRWLLLGVEHGTFWFGARLERFTRLGARGRTDVLTGWQRSRLGLARAGLRGLVALVFLAHYRDAPAFAAIGYGGPLAPGFAGPPASAARYARLLAPPEREPGW